LSNNSAANAPAIIEVLRRTGGAAQNFGLAKEEVAGLASAFLSLGMSPEIAATSLKGFATDLANAKKAGTGFQESLIKLGTTSVRLAQDIRDNPRQAILDLLGSINELEGSEVTGVLTDMFGKANQSNVASLAKNVDQLSDAFDLVAVKADYAGSVTEEFDKKNETTESRVKLMSNSLTAVSIEIGSQLLPMLKSGADSISKVSDGFNKAKGFAMSFAAGFAKMQVAVSGRAKALGKALTFDFEGANRELELMETQLLAIGDAHFESMEELFNTARQAKDEVITFGDVMADIERQEKEARLARIANDGKVALARALANEEEAASIERLNEQLAKFGQSYNSIEEGITKKGNDAINTFERIGRESAATSSIIRESFIATLKEIETPVEAQKLIDSFEEIRSQTNEAGDAFKVTAEDAIMLAPELLALQEAIANGAKVDADWAEVLSGVNEQLEKKRLGLMAVTSEHEKQVEAINKQLKKEEELIDSKIRALKAERDLATARDDLAHAAELNRQIAEQELQLLNKQVATNAKLTELDQQALARLEAKREAGEKLTKAELEQIDALKHSIALRANEVAALGASAEAKAIDTQATDANTAALQRRNNAASGASKSIKKTAEAVDDVDKATKKTTSSGGGSTKFSSWLKDAGDTALLAQSQIDGLKNSVLGAQKYLVGGVQDIHGFVNANKHLRYEIEQLQKGVDRFKSLRDEISALKDPTLDQVLNFEAMANSINSIDDQALGAVKSQLQGMKDEILALRQESEQLLDSLKKEQAKAMGRDYRLTQSQKLLEIEEKIAEAKAKGDMTAVRNLEEAMGIQQRIDRISYVKNRREEEPKITKRVAIDLNIGNEPHQMETDEQTAERVLRAIERKKRVSTRR
ncbi:MAG: phage tail tape measure protein, partial [Xanthomonadaceae bacterium]|nr:phage tail tape measure protein [Xanthomonadaceae bacterium]